MNGLTDTYRVQAHPRVLEWHDKVQNDINEAESKSILLEMDEEEAIRAFFEN